MRMPPRNSEKPPPDPSLATRESPGAGIRHRLGGRILALTLLPILLAIGVSVVLVERQVKALTEREIDEHLAIARTLALDLLAAREADLLTQGWIVARDPKFFAMLAPMGIDRDASYRRTLDDIANQFAEALDSDRLEIIDEDGVSHAQWESRRSSLGHTTVPRNVAADPDIELALRGRAATGVREAENGILLQTAAVPVLVGERIVGVLRHGRRIDTELVGRIRSLTRCEVAFRIEDRVVESTLLDRNVSHIEAVEPLDSSLDAQIAILLYRSVEPEERFLASLRGHLVLIGLGVVAASLVFARTLVRQLTGPVHTLVRAAIHLERDEADTPIDIRTGDELEYLGRRFGEMRSTLRDQIRSLRELDRMKSAFLAIASHELRTPMTIIQGNVELLDYVEAPEDEQYAEAVDGLKRGVSRLHGVLERIGDMTLLDNEKMRLSMRPLDARDAIPGLRLYWERISSERELSFDVSVPESPVPVCADAGRIRQAIQNLLHNALRFTPDGGAVRLTLGAEGDQVSFAVEDTGVGVAHEDRERIFEAFYEARDVLGHGSGANEFGASGIGLGLALARSIAKAHRGEVRYEPISPSGSRFRLQLPLAAASLPTEPEERAA